MIGPRVGMFAAQSGVPPLVAVLTSIVSAIAIVVSVLTWRSTRKEDVSQFLRSLWNDTLRSGIENPTFLDVHVTENYHRRLKDDERSRYDVYCYKAWTQVEAIVTKGFHEDPQFKAVIAWNTAYNGEWIDRNPTFFTSPEFWTVVEQFRNSPQILLRYRPLPKKGEDVDWDIVCPDYHNYILGPFAPEMVSRDDTTGAMRNLLLDELLALPWGSLRDAEIADFGCGPGFMLDHLGGRISGITGVDKSQASLRVASDVANRNGIDFSPVHADFLDLRLAKRFDLVIASNSILPQDRRDVIRILGVIRDHLKPGGRLYAIMPSYDTTLYLQSLWKDHYTQFLGDEGHADRIVKAFRHNKLANDDEAAYADDGQIVQSYHTPGTIKREFHAAGLRLVREPKKILYPWELTKRFDYGYFPQAEEEIWDWFVVAEVEPTRRREATADSEQSPVVASE
ncbi:MAG: class I SAM-dependent methyltransferase [Actinomycetota bacterium]|nr:class I SAM-dependent methyltransferase [Actinomycetota bacterium]